MSRAVRLCRTNTAAGYWAFVPSPPLLTHCGTVIPSLTTSLAGRRLHRPVLSTFLVVDEDLLGRTDAGWGKGHHRRD